MKEQVIYLKNSIGINVKDFEGNGEALLLLHFAAGNNEIWNGVVPYFKDEYRIIAPDLRGHGKSDKPENGYHIDQMAEDIYLLLQELNIKSCHVIGSSLGAEVAVSFAASYPEMVKSLVCEGALYNEYGEYGLFNGTEEEINAEKEKRRAKIGTKIMPLHKTSQEVVDATTKLFKDEGLWNEYFSRFVESNVCKMKDGQYGFCFPQYASNDYVKHYIDFEFDKYYRKIKSPVLFLPSEQEWKDERIQKTVKKFGELVNNYEIKHIDGSYHAYVWMQFPDKASEIVQQFLETLK